jgi:RNA polymerase sigma-70 factor, ECF subfamily
MISSMAPPTPPGPATDPDADLVDGARGGDVGAFTALVERHDPALRRLAYRLLGDRARMDDALQEAYLKAFRGLRGFRGDSTFSTWLHRIVYNACLDELRGGARVRLVPLEAASGRSDPSRDPAETAAERRDLAAALASLPPEMRAAVLLVDAEGLDYAGAGEVLGIPVGTVASRLSRARALLRTALGEGSEGREGA